MQKNNSGKSLLALKNAGMSFIIGGSVGLPKFVLDAIEASKNKQITITLKGLSKIVDSTSKEFALTVYSAEYDNKQFEVMLPLSAYLADGDVRVTSEKVTLKSGKETTVLRITRMTVKDVVVDPNTITEKMVWDAISKAEKAQKAQQKAAVVTEDDDDDEEDED